MKKVEALFSWFLSVKEWPMGGLSRGEMVYSHKEKRVYLPMLAFIPEKRKKN